MATREITYLQINDTGSSNGQVLQSNGSAVIWATLTTPSYTWTNTHTFNANVTINGTLVANSGYALETTDFGMAYAFSSISF